MHETSAGLAQSAGDAKASRHIPGPRGLELVAALRALSRAPHEFLLQLAMRYGPVVCMPFPRDTVIVVSDPHAIQYIFHNNYANYSKQTRRWQSFAQVIGKEGLFTTDGDAWRRQRQRVQPAFHQDRLAHFERVVASETHGMLGCWRRLAADGTPVAVNREMLRLSLLTIVKAMFGADIRAIVDPALKAFAQAHVFINPVSLVNLIQPPLPIRRILAPGFRGFEEAIRLLDDVIRRIVAERRTQGMDTGDLLSMLLASRDEEAGDAMSESQVRDEVMTMFMAGHETVAIALTWTCYLLSRYPAARRELQAELATVLSGRVPTLDDIPRLPFTRMVLEESMRLYPPAWGLDRHAEHEDVVGGYEIPAGASMAISSYVVHRLPAYWRNPEGFDPSRFAPANSAGRPQYAYFPFGGGPRRCIGMRFAMAQMQLVLAMVLQQFELDLVPGPPIPPRPIVNFSPSRDVMMHLRLRPEAS
jgi:cytochrome P450